MFCLCHGLQPSAARVYKTAQDRLQNHSWVLSAVVLLTWSPSRRSAGEWRQVLGFLRRLGSFALLINIYRDRLQLRWEDSVTTDVKKAEEDNKCRKKGKVERDNCGGDAVAHELASPNYKECNEEEQPVCLPTTLCLCGLLRHLFLLSPSRCCVQLVVNTSCDCCYYVSCCCAISVIIWCYDVILIIL